MKNYRQSNVATIKFKDGTYFKSPGSSSGQLPHDLSEDLRFLSAVLPGYIRDKGKTMLDVDSITIELEYTETNG